MIPSSIIGIGSHHGDDRLGWIVLDELRQSCPQNANVQYIKCERGVLDWWQLAVGAKQWLFIDAIRSGASPGTLHTIECKPRRESYSQYHQSGQLSNHGISLLDAIELADTLGVLPAYVSIWGIEVQQTGRLQNMSDVVSSAIPGLLSGLVQVVHNA